MCRVQGRGISARSRGCGGWGPRDLALIPPPCTLHTPYRRIYNCLISFHYTTWGWPTFVAKTCSCASHIVNSIPPNLLVVFDDIHIYLIVWFIRHKTGMTHHKRVAVKMLIKSTGPTLTPRSICRFVRKILKSDYQLRHVCPSVSMKQLRSHWMECHEIWYSSNFLKPDHLEHCLFQTLKQHGWRRLFCNNSEVEVAVR